MERDGDEVMLQNCIREVLIRISAGTVAIMTEIMYLWVFFTPYGSQYLDKMTAAFFKVNSNSLFIVFNIFNIKSDIYKEYENRTSSKYIIPIVNKQYDSNVADLEDAPDDGPLWPIHVVLSLC
jgi:hypothetical protein